MHIISITVSSSTAIHGCPNFHQVVSKLPAGYSPGVRKCLLVTRIVPITQSMLSLILEEYPPRYFVDLIRNKSAPIDLESPMCAWFRDATTQNPDNPAHSALQLRFTACTQLNRESGDTMFSDLDEAFEDTGVTGTLVRQCYLPPPPPLEPPADAATTTTTTTTTVTTTIEAQLQQLQTQNIVGTTALTGQNAANHSQGTTQALQPTHPQQQTLQPNHPQ